MFHSRFFMGHFSQWRTVDVCLVDFTTVD
jgi:hypothetical protein